MSSSINIVLYFPIRKSLSESKKTQQRHSRFLAYFPDSVNIYLIEDPKSFLKNDIFIVDYKWKKGEWKKCKQSTIYANLILGFPLLPEFKNIYHNPIKEISKDKRVFPKLFPQYSVNYISCNNYLEICNAFPQINSPLKVLKPSQASKGEGVIIQSSLPSESEILDEHYPYLVQEFFDTSNGIDEHKGIHDFRVVILNGQIIGKWLRLAPTNSYIASLSRGGTCVDYEYKEIPSPFISVIQSIEAYCSKKYPHRYYSIDMGLGKNNEVKVFEINSAPMLSTISIEKNLAEHIVKNILKVQ